MKVKVKKIIESLEEYYRCKKEEENQYTTIEKEIKIRIDSKEEDEESIKITTTLDENIKNFLTKVIENGITTIWIKDTKEEKKIPIDTTSISLDDLEDNKIEIEILKAGIDEESMKDLKNLILSGNTIILEIRTSPLFIIERLKERYEREIGNNVEIDIGDLIIRNNIEFYIAPAGFGKTHQLIYEIKILKSGGKKIVILAPYNSHLGVIKRRLKKENIEAYFYPRDLKDKNLDGNKYPILITIDMCIVDEKAMKYVENSDVIIIDEVSSKSYHFILYFLYKFRNKKIIIASDPEQNILWEKDYGIEIINEFKNSIFDVIDDNTIEYLMSKKNKMKNYEDFRHGRKIFDFLNEGFWKNSKYYKNCKFICNKENGGNVEVYIIDDSDVKEQKEKHISKYQLMLLSKLNLDNKKAGIITLYKDQKRLAKFFKRKGWLKNIKRIENVHKSQGDELDCVIYMITDPYPDPYPLKKNYKRTFINNERLHYVATSRACEELILIVDKNLESKIEFLKNVNDKRVIKSKDIEDEFINKFGENALKEIDKYIKENLSKPYNNQSKYIISNIPKEIDKYLNNHSKYIKLLTKPMKCKNKNCEMNSENPTFLNKRFDVIKENGKYYAFCDLCKQKFEISENDIDWNVS